VHFIHYILFFFCPSSGETDSSSCWPIAAEVADQRSPWSGQAVKTALSSAEKDHYVHLSEWFGPRGLSSGLAQHPASPLGCGTTHSVPAETRSNQCNARLDTDTLRNLPCSCASSLLFCMVPPTRKPRNSRTGRTWVVSRPRCLAPLKR
jgi:hypothetical protein